MVRGWGEWTWVQVREGGPVGARGVGDGGKIEGWGGVCGETPPPTRLVEQPAEQVGLGQVQ